MLESQQYITTAALMDTVYEEVESGNFVIRPVDLDDLLSHSITIRLEGDCTEYEPITYGRWEPIKNTRNEIDFRCTACHQYRFHNGEMRRKFLRCPHCGAHMINDPNDASE